MSRPERLTLGAIAKQLGADLVHASAEAVVTRCDTLTQADRDAVSFLTNAKYLQAAQSSAAAVVICNAKDAERLPGRGLMVAGDPYLAFRNALVLLHAEDTPHKPGVSPLAHVDPDAQVSAWATIGPGCVIGPNAVVGAKSVLHANVFIGADAHVGAASQLYPGVCVYPRCRLGDRVTLHAGCSIGHDGFGYATGPAGLAVEFANHTSPDDVVHHKIPQTGIAVIEDDVEMGANCSVDRATLGETRIGRGTKFSDNVVIGHGCTIGADNLFVGHVGVAGSVTTGRYVVLGGQVGVVGHVTLGDRVQVAGSSKVVSDLPADGKYGGTPAIALNDAKRVVLQQQRLPDMAARLKRLEREIKKLQADRDAT